MQDGSNTALGKQKSICLFVGIFFVFSTISLTTLLKDSSTQPILQRNEIMKTIVHLDLKGAPPRVEYLQQFFQLLSSLDVDGVLMEYEDMFPYSGNLSDLPQPNHYTTDDIHNINSLADQNGLELIPLVQTFGHLEFVLKLDRFKHLRENQTANNTICPSDHQSLELIDEMVRQIRELHPNATTIHLGADEAYHVAEDGRCKEALISHFNESVDELKLNHIANVALLGRKYKFDRILVWNDMFGGVNASLLAKYKLGQLVEPVVWGYAVDVTVPNYFPKKMFKEYSQEFNSIVFGSAFKGANGIDQTFSEIQRYVANLGSYHQLQTIESDYLSDKVGTIILTGWQRFWHGSPLCELLPVGIPSLVYEMSYIKNWQSTFPKIDKKWVEQVLNCTNPQPVTPIKYHGNVFHPPLEWNFLKCFFPGANLYDLIEKFRFTRWKAAVSIPGDESIKRELQVLKTELQVALSEIYFEDTVNEFIAQNLEPVINFQPVFPTQPQ
ncbi:unnamed protein product [Bursaphelenchus okinawaensis]|uniref:beta-N-acetylhexosaminidase n=1 Tax=Bursaphelenchus okinawaensis TaxID=465554 RepID=A0A811JSM4_9BILA|nr:unnamed protein product [Bursaphelenchus okinawaensis]CAG9081082.1 unnamed protein product [Bursaphelenchus okinawaensis]